MKDLDKFQNQMNLSGQNVYVGHRYVPKHLAEWDINQPYESLSVVTYQGNSFTSRQNVPIGIDINDEDYWASTGNYNAQVENYRIQVVNNQKEVANARVGYENLSERLQADKDYVSSNFQSMHANVKFLPKQYTSAIGDGVADDTQAIKDAFSISDTVYFPKGTYKITESLVFDKPVHFKGYNKESTFLVNESLNDLIIVNSDSQDDKILTIKDLAINSENNTESSLINVARKNTANGIFWGARVSIENINLNINDNNIGIKILAPFDTHIKDVVIKAPDTRPLTDNNMTPRNNAIGMLLTGKDTELETMGNVLSIENSYILNAKYGLRLINIQGAVINNTVFERNWISSYMTSEGSSKWGTTRILFNNCWVEDAYGSHPDYALLDCFIDETNGLIDVNKNVAKSPTLINNYFHQRKIGLPASSGFNIQGRDYTQDNATNNYLIRQYDRLEELEDIENNDGVVMILGGNKNYFRGGISTPNGFTKIAKNEGLYNTNNKIVNETHYFRFNNAANTNEYTTELDLVTDLNTPTPPTGYWVSSEFEITAMIQLKNYINSKVKIIFSPSRSGLADVGKVVYLTNENGFLNVIDENFTGLKVSKNGTKLVFNFNGEEIHGAHVTIESKHILHLNANAF